MKSKLSFIFIFLFSITLVSANYDPGAWIYENTQEYNGVRAEVRVESTGLLCEGEQNGVLCAGQWYTDVSHDGDELHYGTNVRSWPSANVNSDGFLIDFGGLSSIEDGKRYLETNSEGEVLVWIICDFDRDTRDGYWTWASICGGYLDGEGPNTNTINNIVDGEPFRNVDCITDNQCSGDQICGANNVCELQICSTGDEICNGDFFLECDVSQNDYINRGKVAGKCGVQCIVDSDCSGIHIEQDPYCSEGFILQDEMSSVCEVNKCEARTETNQIGLCEVGANETDDPVDSDPVDSDPVNNTQPQKKTIGELLSDIIKSIGQFFIDLFS